MGGRRAAEIDGRPTQPSRVSGQQLLDASYSGHLRCRARWSYPRSFHGSRLSKTDGDRRHACCAEKRVRYLSRLAKVSRAGSLEISVLMHSAGLLREACRVFLSQANRDSFVAEPFLTHRLPYQRTEAG